MDLSRLDTTIYRFMEQTPFNFGYYHPYIVDFAIVLPILALFFHFLTILNQTGDNKDFFKAGNFLFFSSIIAILLAYLTGIAQGTDVRDTLSLEGKGIYDAHSTLGTALFLIFMLLFIFKIISLIVKKDPVRYIFGTLFFFTILMIIYQDFIGISLVFDYGAGVVSR